MRVLGIDPGATTGWCIFDPTHPKIVVAQGTYHGSDTVVLMPMQSVADVVVIERLVPHGASYPQVVEAAHVAGTIGGELRHAIRVHEMTRSKVRGILQDACHGAVKVKDDKTVRAALIELHGGPECVDKGGQLASITGHVWASFAVAYAWWLTQPN